MVRHNWPVFQVANEVGPTVFWLVTQIGLDLHLHFGLFVLLLFKIRMAPPKVQW